jgi:hypothetical protein
MSYHGVSNWPPAWVWVGGGQNTRPIGEVGHAQEVLAAKITPAYGCFLIIKYQEAAYMGALLFDEPSFCTEIYGLLRNYVGHTVQEMGSLDVSHLL